MKYFVISDIHGYYNVMMDSLQKAGYNENNQNHFLLVCGDMFDRGDDSDKVFEYLYRLTEENKAKVIIGNHDIFLLDFLEGDFSRTAFNIEHNGHKNTIDAFSSIPFVDNFEEVKENILQNYPNLLPWLQTLPLFYELEDYIFVHGGIDGSMLDWKTMSSTRDFVWGREVNLPPVPGKTVVAGHHRVATIRKQTTDYHKLYLYEPNLFDIMYLEGKILIDRFVEVTQELNVLVLEIDG